MGLPGPLIKEFEFPLQSWTTWTLHDVPSTPRHALSLHVQNTAQIHAGSDNIAAWFGIRPCFARAMRSTTNRDASAGRANPASGIVTPTVELMFRSRLLGYELWIDISLSHFWATL